MEGNQDAWELWGKVNTQWRTAGMGGARVGLDYGAVGVIADALEVELDKVMFGKIFALEQASLAEQSRRMRAERERDDGPGGHAAAKTSAKPRRRR